MPFTGASLIAAINSIVGGTWRETGQTGTLQDISEPAAASVVPGAYRVKLQRYGSPGADELARGRSAVGREWVAAA